MQTKLRDFTIISNNETITNFNINNLHSSYGNIIIKDFIINGVLYDITDITFKNISNININIQTNNITSVHYYNIHNSNFLFCDRFNFSIDMDNAFFNSVLIFSYINKEEVLGNNIEGRIYNSNIFIKNTSIKYISNTSLTKYNKTIYPETAYIVKDSQLVLNINNKYNFIFLNIDNQQNSLHESVISYKDNSNTNYYLNNNSKYVLDCHAHIVKINENDNISDLTNQNYSGQIFPIQTITKNLTHKKLTNQSKEYVLQESTKSTYLPIEKSLTTTYVPENTLLPIGSIIGWCQIKDTSTKKWVPSVPYGFYMLSTVQASVLVDYDNPKSLTYNGQLAALYDANIQLKLPAGKIIYYNNNSARLIHIIKYSDNWQYTQNRQAEEQFVK